MYDIITPWVERTSFIQWVFSGKEKFRVSAIYIIAEHLLFPFSMEYLTVSAYKIRYAKWLKKKKSLKNLRSSVLCHNLTIYKQFSTHKFKNTLSINYTKKKHKPWKARLDITVKYFVWKVSISNLIHIKSDVSFKYFANLWLSLYSHLVVSLSMIFFVARLLRGRRKNLDRQYFKDWKKK